MLRKIVFFIIVLSNVWPHLNASAPSKGALQVAAVVAAAAQADAAKNMLKQAGEATTAHASAGPATDPVSALKRKRVSPYSTKATELLNPKHATEAGNALGLKHSLSQLMAGKKTHYESQAVKDSIDDNTPASNDVELTKSSAATKEKEDKVVAMDESTSASASADAAAQEEAQKPLLKKGHCATCNKSFKNLAKHAIIHTEDKPFACTQCDHRCNRESNMKLHMRNIHKAKYVSPAVDLKKAAEAATPADQSASASMLDADSAQDHSSAAAASALADALSCCGTTFKNSHALKIHQGKSAKHKENAAAQVSPDADEEEAGDPSLAKQPKRKKSKLNPAAAANVAEIMCAECNQKFETRQGLGSHLKHKHPAANDDASASDADETFECSHADCGRVFPSKRGYNNHMRTHRSATDASSEKAADEDDALSAEEFRCDHDDCNRVFKRQQDLNRHANTHNKKWYYPSDEDEDRDDSPKADKPLKKRAAAAAAVAALKTKSLACKVTGCNMSFPNAKALKKHSWQGHSWNKNAGGASGAEGTSGAPEAQVLCTDCDKTFKDDKCLKIHRGKMHKANASASAKEDSDDDEPLATKLKSATEESADSKVQNEILALKKRLQQLTEYEEQQRKLKKEEVRLKKEQQLLNDQEKQLNLMRAALFGNTGK